MKPEALFKLRHGTGPTKSLANVLTETEHVKDLVEECSDELSSANTGIKEELDNLHALPGVASALEKNKNVEQKLQDVSTKLSIVNRGLTGQVRDRDLLDHQFAAAVEQEAAARHAALNDGLTDLPNRALFDDRLPHELAQAKRHGWTIAVMFVDLDKFKEVNDTYGHEAGDSILRTIARRLDNNTRSEDTVSRYGGDEFLLLLTETQNEEHVALIANKLIEAIQAPCYVSVNDVSICHSIKASIGIACFPKDGDTAEALVKRADAAMYVAKGTKSGFAFAE
jgi:diguanylate cyclase